MLNTDEFKKAVDEKTSIFETKEKDVNNSKNVPSIVPEVPRVKPKPKQDNFIDFSKNIQYETLREVML